MEANWVAPAFISGIIFLAACLAEYNIKWTYRVAITLVLILLPIIKMPKILYLVNTVAKFQQLMLLWAMLSSIVRSIIIICSLMI